MEEETKIIEKIKALKKTPSKEKFLGDLRANLVAYISVHPAKNESAKSFWFLKNLSFPFGGNFSIDKSRMLQKTAGAFLIIFLMGTGGATIASQSALPGQPLYPVKIFTEDIRSTMAASPQTKARLETEFAAKRVAEVKIMMETNSAEPQKIEMAMNRLQQNASNAAYIIDTEKQKGIDISGLAKNINDNFDKNQEALDGILEEQKNNIKKQKRETSSRIAAVNQAGDAAQADFLAKHLDYLANSKEALETNFSANKKSLEGISAAVAKHMKEEEKKSAARKNAERAIKKAEKSAEKKQELLAEMEGKNIDSVAAAIAEFNDLFGKSKSSFDSEKYDEAAGYARDAAEKKLEKRMNYERSRKENGEKIGENESSD
jgi:hypothetical protein